MEILSSKKKKQAINEGGLILTFSKENAAGNAVDNLRGKDTAKSKSSSTKPEKTEEKSSAPKMWYESDKTSHGSNRALTIEGADYRVLMMPMTSSDTYVTTTEMYVYGKKRDLNGKTVLFSLAEPLQIEDREEYVAFISAATRKNATYKGNIPFENFVFTANHCYLYNTIEGVDIYPVKQWNIELNHDEIDKYTKRIERDYRRRGNDALDSILSDLFRKKGNVSSNSVDDRKINRFHVGPDGVYERSESDRASDYSESYSPFGEVRYSLANDNQGIFVSNAEAAVGRIKGQTMFSLPEPLRRLKPGETCYVERKFTEDHNFSFTGRDRIESLDDIAYIFRSLADTSLKNSFFVFTDKDGKATIVHAGMKPVRHGVSGRRTEPLRSCSSPKGIPR